VANLPTGSTTPGKFATWVNDTGDKFFNSFASATGINDTGVKFATGVNDTGGKQWEQLSKKRMTNFLIEDFFHLPPVSTTPVVHLELRISLRIFEKI
jgi:hypothetical protein